MYHCAVAATKSSYSEPKRAPQVILFAETRGFTRTSEILQPDVVLARLSEFFALVFTVIERHQGLVVDILNDTLCATFAGKDDARRAVQAAQDIQREFGALEEAWERDFGIRGAVAMGLHGGEAVLGTLKGERMPEQPLVIGDAVSVAQRLLHRARAGEFVLSDTVMNALKAAKIDLQVEELPPLEIPKRDPILLYGVLLDTRLDFT